MPTGTPNDLQVLVNSDQQVSSSDINSISSLLYQIIRNSNKNILAEDNAVISGLAVTYVSGNTINISAGVALFSVPQTVSTYAGSIYYLNNNVSPTIAAADHTNNRIDGIDIQYTEVNGTSQTRNFINPGTGVISPTATNTQILSTYNIQITTGTPSGSPVAPAIPSGFVRLATYEVPFNGGGTVTVTNITQITPLMFENQTFPGTPNTANQSSSIADNLASIRHQLNAIIGATDNHWYDLVPTNLTLLAGISPEYWGGTSTFVSNVYQLTISNFPSNANILPGTKITFVADLQNLGACFVSVNTQANISINDSNNISLWANKINIGQQVTISYDGTEFRIEELGNTNFLPTYDQARWWGYNSDCSPALNPVGISGALVLNGSGGQSVADSSDTDGTCLGLVSNTGTGDVAGLAPSANLWAVPAGFEFGGKCKIDANCQDLMIGMCDIAPPTSFDVNFMNSNNGFVLYFGAGAYQVINNNGNATQLQTSVISTSTLVITNFKFVLKSGNLYCFVNANGVLGSIKITTKIPTAGTKLRPFIYLQGSSGGAGIGRIYDFYCRYSA